MMVLSMMQGFILHTRKKGLSTSIIDGKNGGSLDTDNLPQGLGFIKDGDDHVSIYPSDNMTFGEYQKN